jgi:DNA repair exonuclease SbcCD nuclease subunit
MIVYINQDPIPLYTAVPRALPVRVVNNNSFQVTNVSSPCVDQYAKGELHKVKEVQINNATILCDPGSPQYFIILSEVNGDYHIHLKKADGTPVEFVITYKDDGLDPTPTSIINIANSFKTR